MNQEYLKLYNNFKLIADAYDLKNEIRKLEIKLATTNSLEEICEIAEKHKKKRIEFLDIINKINRDNS